MFRHIYLHKAVLLIISILPSMHACMLFNIAFIFALFNYGTEYYCEHLFRVYVLLSLFYYYYCSCYCLAAVVLYTPSLGYLCA